MFFDLSGNPNGVESSQPAYPPAPPALLANHRRRPAARGEDRTAAVRRRRMTMLGLAVAVAAPVIGRQASRALAADLRSPLDTGGAASFRNDPAAGRLTDAQLVQRGRDLLDSGQYAQAEETLAKVPLDALDPLGRRAVLAAMDEARQAPPSAPPRSMNTTGAKPPARPAGSSRRRSTTGWPPPTTTPTR